MMMLYADHLHLDAQSAARLLLLELASPPWHHTRATLLESDSNLGIIFDDNLEHLERAGFGRV